MGRAQASKLTVPAPPCPCDAPASPTGTADVAPADNSTVPTSLTLACADEERLRSVLSGRIFATAVNDALATNRITSAIVTC